MKIIDLIPTGESNAISRTTLCSLCGLSDRLMRKEIAKLSREYPICNLQNGNGYFLASDVSTARIMLNQEIHRAKSIFWKIKGLRKFINENEV